jgi:hypothetical protein
MKHILLTLLLLSPLAFAEDYKFGYHTIAELECKGREDMAEEYGMTIYSYSRENLPPVYHGIWWQWLGRVTKGMESDSYQYEVWETSSSYNVKRKYLADGLEDKLKNWYYEAVSVNRKTLEVTYSNYGSAFVNEHGEIIGGITEGIYLPPRTTVYDCESLESKNQI